MPDGIGCFLHATHSPLPVKLVTHHVVPLGMGGPDAPENRRRVCDTGHRNVHEHLAALVFARPEPAVGSRTERALARLGYERWTAMGAPGNPHAAYALHPHEPLPPAPGPAPIEEI